MDSKETKNLLYKSKNQSNKPIYKRAFPRANGSDFRYRPLSTDIINPKDPVLFEEVRLHSNVKHPDYPNNAYGANIRCLGKGCPLCRDFYETEKAERASGILRGGNAWKKRANNFTLYWVLDRTNNNELTLVHINNTPTFIWNKKTESKERVGHTLQEIIFNKLVTATEKGLTPFNYRGGNDITLRNIKIDNKVKWDVSVIEEKNDVPQEVINKLRDMPALSEIYKPYSWEELECMVRGISLRNAKDIKRIVKGNSIKEKEKENKEKTFNEEESLPTKTIKKENPPIVKEKKEDSTPIDNEKVDENNLEKSLMETTLEDEEIEEEDNSPYSKNFGASIDDMFRNMTKGEDDE